MRFLGKASSKKKITTSLHTTTADEEMNITVFEKM